MPGLRQSMFAGEALTLDQARAWKLAAPHSSIDNAYGPTELTITCAAYRLPGEPDCWPVTRNGTVPIGEPYPGLDWAVLSTADSPGEGELCVRGPQRFDGYLDAENDQGRFCQLAAGSDGHPVATDVIGAPGPQDWFRTGDNVCLTEDGMVHLGRLDNQVQVHGYRVELGEVEAALRAHGEVDEAAVIARNGVLTGWYSGGPSSTAELADWLARTLPSYMIPDRLQRIEALPINSNGKIDRRALADQAA
jgi:acyl-coenzyme A synthetase/AMP-(fatty) acid ligase